MAEYLVYSINELADAVRKTRQNVHKHIKKGNIKAVLVGGVWRIPRSEYLRLTGQSDEERQN